MSGNFHSFPSFSVSAVNPLFKHFSGYPWNAMEGLWELRGSNPLTRLKSGLGGSMTFSASSDATDLQKRPRSVQALKM